MDFAHRLARSIVQAWVRKSRWLRLFGGSDKGKDATPPVHRILRIEYYGRRLRIGTTGSVSTYTKPPLAIWAESFIFAGSSALLLLLATLFPQYWYFSFFALTPVLYRIISAKGAIPPCGTAGQGYTPGGKATLGESLRLGFLFGLSFFGALAVNSFFTSPFVSTLQLLSGTALFALFGWAVGWAQKRWGFNPFIVAVLWVVLEMGLMKVGFVGGLVVNEANLLLGEVEFSHPFLHGLIALFGFLAVSAIIVFLNSLLALAIVKTLEIKRPRGETTAEDESILDLFFISGLSAQKVYFVPEGRAPPIFSTLS